MDTVIHLRDNIYFTVSDAIKTQWKDMETFMNAGRLQRGVSKLGK